MTFYWNVPLKRKFPDDNRFMTKIWNVVLNVGWCLPLTYYLSYYTWLTIHTAEPKIPFYTDIVIILGPQPSLNPLTLPASTSRMSLEVMLILTELSFRKPLLMQNMHLLSSLFIIPTLTFFYTFTKCTDCFCIYSWENLTPSAVTHIITSPSFTNLLITQLFSGNRVEDKQLGSKVSPLDPLFWVN